ncbi:uncharacterized protein LOC128301408 [Anopheles moucheti]|uniref:uncharacterized protein LOC128301408 n=1 Tax=Anopheles moucheti TaxID=186751 RepID=UPI0022F03B87|nr:uncharacterized protein LOC128301408 [Anopheles moucheti]
MTGSCCESGKYFLVGAIGVLLIGNVFSSPLPAKDGFGEEWESNNEIDQVTAAIIEETDQSTERTTTTTERTITTSSTTTEQVITTSSTTTEYPYAAIAAIYSSPPDKTLYMQYASGTHDFRVGHNQDEVKRTIEEYQYHFERVEKGLPPTTKRGFHAPPNNY